MAVDILYPWVAWPALVLAAAALAALWRSGVGARRRSGRWRMVCLVLPGVAAVGALLAGSGLSLRLGGGPADNMVLLLDISASARGSPWQKPEWVRELALQRLARGSGEGAADHLTVVGFAAQPRVLLEDVSAREPARWPSAWADFGKGEATDVAAALAWRSPGETDALAAPRWLITDGIFPWPAGGHVAAVTVIPPRADAGITDLAWRAGALWVQVRCLPGASPREVDIRRDGRVLAQQHLTFTPADHAHSLWLSIPATQDAGVYEAQLSGGSGAGTGDLWPENDTARLVVPGPQEPRVLTLHAGDHLPGGPWKLAADGWQTVELLDVPADALGAAEWQNLDSFVRDTGGGLVIAGGQHAFGPGGYGGEPIADALSPVWSGPHEDAAAEVVFLLDASASMNESAEAASASGGGAASKFRVAWQGIGAALRLLAPQDRVAVITFNGGARIVDQGTCEAVAAALDHDMAAIQPSGGTAPDTALAPAQQILTGSRSARKLAVLLTDGEVPAMDAAAWEKMLHDTQTGLAILAPRAARVGPLAALGKQAEWLNADDPEQWAALFREAVAAVSTGRARTDNLPWHTRGDANPLSGAADEWIETWPKPEAERLADGRLGDRDWPVAATAQRGLGRVAALPIAPAGANAQALLDRVVQQVLPPAGDRRFVVAAAHDDEGGWTVTADGVDGEHFLDGEALRVRVPEPARNDLQDVPMMQTGPGHYVARVPDAAGALVLRDAGSPGATASPLVGRIVAATVGSQEWPASGESAAIPAQAARIEPDQPGAPWEPRVAARELDLAPWLWAAAALAALGAIWGRVGARA